MTNSKKRILDFLLDALGQGREFRPDLKSMQLLVNRAQPGEQPRPKSLIELDAAQLAATPYDLCDLIEGRIEAAPDGTVYELRAFFTDDKSIREKLVFVTPLVDDTRETMPPPAPQAAETEPEKPEAEEVDHETFIRGSIG